MARRTVAKSALPSLVAIHKQRSLRAISVSHELLDTLHAIRGYMEVLCADLGANGASADILGRLDRASETALALAQNSLDLANPDGSSVVVGGKGQRSTLH